MPEALSRDFVALQTALAGRYSLDREIGRGGMGVVYLARDVALERPVAIKLLPPDMAKDAELRARFLREARIAAQLSHPNIVPIHLVEEQDGLVYFVMALVDGESLGDRVRRAGPLRPADTTRMLQEVAWALAYAHGRGVVHRDVKPDNILLERATGRALVTDFGIARSTSAPALTAHGLILGTLHYMAPEQASGDATVDGRADIYALGITAFYALTGRLPFESANAQALIAAHLLEPAPPVATLAADLPARLATAVDRCLAKDPAARWPSGEALAEALADVPQSRAAPPSIRAFATAVQGAWLQLGTLTTLAMFSNLLLEEQFPTIAKLLLALTPLIFLQVVAAARAVGIAGFTARDVADILGAEEGLSDRYTEYMQSETQRGVKQLSTRWGRLAIGALGVLSLFTGIGALAILVPKGGLALIWMVPVLGVITWLGAEQLNHAVGIGPWKNRLIRWWENAPARKVKMLRAMWGLAPVRWLLALGKVGVPKALRTGPATALPAASQPTEAILARAAGAMFDALPPADQATLAAVPDVVRALEAAAARLRERKAALDAALADVGDPGAASGRRAELTTQLTAERARIEQRLAAAVEALENLRLDLLKLRAGMGSTGDLTEGIAAARRVGEDVDHLLAGRREVDALTR